MATANHHLFYTRLPVNEIPLADLLTEQHLFFNVPASWHMVITDIRNSTIAVQNGTHQSVNLVATGCIVAVMNIAQKAGLDLPFFFGGDGAAFIVPETILAPVMAALQLHSSNTRQHFELELRVGQLPVQELYAAGQELRITKLRTSDLFSIPVLLGTGLMYAEKTIKAAAEPAGSAAVTELDMSGMECRWDTIRPPASSDEVVSLLVMTANAAAQETVFKKVVQLLDAVYGSVQARRPITSERLRLKTTPAAIVREMRAKFGRYKPLYLLRTWLATLLGRYYFRTKPGKKYLDSLVKLTDTLVIDGRINTVISGTAQQRLQLEAALNSMEQEGELLYGLSVSTESVMSCYVRNMYNQHVHFVDGAGGGYTRAAMVLKKKISS